MAKFRLKDQYVFIDKNGRALPTVKVVEDSNPAFKTQRWKFHPDPIKASEVQQTAGGPPAGGPPTVGENDAGEPEWMPDQFPMDAVMAKDVKRDFLIEVYRKGSGREAPEDATKTQLKQWILAVREGAVPEDADKEFFEKANA